jgi:uncharacterized protein
MRLLILILALVLLIVTVKTLFGRSNSTPDRRQRLSGEKVVPCAHCDLHLPRSEALEADGRFFCGEKHLKEWQSSISRKS